MTDDLQFGESAPEDVDISPPLTAPAAFSAPVFPAEAPPVWKGTDVAIICIISYILSSGLVLLLPGISFLTRITGSQRSLADLLHDPRFLPLTQAGGGFILIAVMVLWIRWRRGSPFWHAVHWNPPDAGRQIIIAISAVLAGGVINSFIRMTSVSTGHMRLHASIAWALALAFIVAGPLAEELLFRGLVYQSLRESLTEGISAADAKRWEPFIWLFCLAMLMQAFGTIVMIRRSSGIPPELMAAARHRIAWRIGLALGAGLFSRALLRLVTATSRVLARLRRPEVLAIIISSLLFAYLHIGSDGYLLFIFALGVVLATIRARTASVEASWVFHAVYNATVLLLGYIAIS